MSLILKIAIVLIACGGLGAILLAIGQWKSSTDDKNEIIKTLKGENSLLKDDLQEIRKERDILNDTLKKRDRNIQEQSKTIIALNQKLAEKSDYIQNYLTGGKSYPFFTMRRFPAKENETRLFLFRLENEFDFPIYDIAAGVFDYDKIKSNSYFIDNIEYPFIKFGDYKAARILELNSQMIPPNEYRTIDKKLPFREGKYYIQIHARNLTIIEKIQVLKIDDDFHIGIQVYKEGKLLREIVDENISTEIRHKLVEGLNSIPTNMRLNIDND